MAMISMCGLDCSDCPCFLAHQNHNQELKEKIAKKWSEEFGWKDLRPEDIDCVGCTVNEGPHFKNCAECGVRKCGLEKGIKNCGECGEYKTCPKIGSLHKVIVDGIERCEEIYRMKPTEN